MTDKEWNHLWGKTRRCSYCQFKGGEDCTARDGKRCFALRDTRLVKGKCLFYRSKSELTPDELTAYDTIAFPNGRRHS